MKAESLGTIHGNLKARLVIYHVTMMANSRDEMGLWYMKLCSQPHGYPKAYLSSTHP